MFFQSLLSLLFASTLHLAYANDASPQFDDSILLGVSPLPIEEENAGQPAQMSAGSILAIDLKSQSILFEKDSNIKRPIASLTKLMTAYIILEENDPNSVVNVSTNASGTGGSRMGLQAGEQITIKDLLYGLLIESGNDASVALAEFNAGSESEFINKMNIRANALGLNNTHYANTSGLDDENAYSTAHDLTVLATHLLKDNTIREIVKNSSFEITSLSGQTHKLINTNILLGESGIKGLKTGKTPNAGECLAVIADTPDNHEILTIVLGSQNRFMDTKILTDWIYNNFTW
ncbi:MAG: D-alanyl-D-alanine carboxypeptidase family protein [Candidatus Gracilibacteria bacterium]